MDGYTLGRNAIRDIGMMKADVNKLNQRVGRIESRGPRDGGCVLVKVLSNIRDSSYQAEQVRAVSGDRSSFEAVPGGLTWGDGSDLGALISYDYTGEAATGVVMACPYSDGTRTYWGFAWTGDTQDDYDFLATSWDGTSLSVNGGWVQVGDEFKDVSPYVGDASVGDYVWFKVVGNINSCYDFSYVIDDTITVGDIGGVRWIEDSTTGDFTAKIEIGYVTDASSFDQDMVGALHWADWARGTPAASSETLDATFTGEIDDQTADNFFFGEDTYTSTTCRGLIKSQEYTDTARVKKLTTLKWIGMEKGGKVYHRSYEDIWTTIRWDMTNQTVSDADTTGSILDMTFDTQGHLLRYAIDGTQSTQPDSTNWEFVHCSDSVTFPNIVVDTSYGAVMVDGQCYWPVGGTEAIATDVIDTTYTGCADCTTDMTNWLYRNCSNPAYLDIALDTSHGSIQNTGGQCYYILGKTGNAVDDTIDSTFADCSACGVDQTSIEFLSQDGSNTVYFTPFVVSDDYIWACHSSTYKKFERIGTSANTPTNPSYIEQCGTAPASFADLIGWPISDSFSGSGCDSGTVGDTNYARRFTRGPGTGTLSIGSGVLSYTGTAYGTDYLAANVPSVSGNVVLSIDYLLNNFGGGSDQYIGVRFFIGGTQVGPITRHYSTVLGNGYRFFNPSSGWQFSASSATSGTLELRRTAGTITAYGGGVQIGTGYSNAGNITGVQIYFQASNGAYDVDVDNFVYTNAGAQIYIDPTGGAC